MRRSQKVEHAFRAMLELAFTESAGPTAVGQIAARARIPVKFLELIFAELRKAALVRSKRGAAGGYSLTRPAEEIRLREIWEAIEGPLSATAPPPSTWRVTATEECLRELWSELDMMMLQALEEQTLAQLRRRRAELRGGDDYSI